MEIYLWALGLLNLLIYKWVDKCAQNAHNFSMRSTGKKQAFTLFSLCGYIPFSNLSSSYLKNVFKIE